MIWGCICYHGVGPLTTVEGNINSAKYIDILDKNVWPVVVWYFEGKEYLFMDDNAPVHRAHIVYNYKDQNEVTSVEWPAQSPGFKYHRKYLALHEERVAVQRAKQVVSDSPGIVDFAIGLVIFVLNLPDGQVLFF